MRRLTKAETEKIYHELMSRHFPAEEIKPWSKISELWDKGRYFAYSWEENGEFLGYALLYQANDGYLLLDYYAVLSQERNKGYGSRFLHVLGEELQEESGIIIEVEDPAYAADEETRKLRERRINFYLRNGCVRSGVLSQAAGVEYVILYLPGCRAADKEDIRTHLLNIYREVLNPRDIIRADYEQ